MPAEFEIRIGDLMIAESGSITGRVAVRVGGQWFPDRNWSDLPIVLLSWWMRERDALLSGDEARLDFTREGFALQVVSRPSGRVAVELLRGDESLSEVSVPLGIVADAVREAAGEALQSCENFSWNTVDIQELRLWLDEDAP